MHKPPVERLMSALALFTLASCLQLLSAQHLVSSQGDLDVIGDLQLSWSLGESLVTTESSSSVLLTQGFQQPAVHIQTIPGRELTADKIDIEVMPNPSTGAVRIRVDIPHGQDVHIRWYDLSGHLVDSGDRRLANGSVEWDISRFPPGTFVLNVLPGDAPAVNFLVTKAQ